MTNEPTQSTRLRYERPTVETLDVGATRGKVNPTSTEATAPGLGS